ncbi:isoleucine--tRNA ligase [Sphingomonas sinipercae]|uniref:Isoleucine--tRNA ligase n=1 Tax=Sphingomonas sinipercae TaxID=2714944 RepID=A0A6G7ZQB2_9SPHN|nr:isoleucine--tRNA ligase [Sphingomonas sinipercae]QIL03115.1 isoleucine--tRNA ligase [Sphingomonas sinipercae]
MADSPKDLGVKPDYRPTVFLPKTDFPMKAGLPQKEPAILARWQEADLYRQVRESRRGREKFILHDGPPYANGDIHIGHALNHILKDMVVRTQTLLGKDAPYVPGWDCHGLPIEWKVEEQYRKKKLNKDEVPVTEFRAECRAYAQHWVDVQREQLKRLGIGGDWDHPYLTMNFDAEATIVSELMKFAESGQLYRGAKPVMWSPVEKTALAEAEIEYEDIVSTQIDVAFEIVESPIPELVGAHAVVWTTTPWTIPVNQAIAYGPEVEYVLVTTLVEAEGAPEEWTPPAGSESHYSTKTSKEAVGRAEQLMDAMYGETRYLIAKALVPAVEGRLTAALSSIDVSDMGATRLKMQLPALAEFKGSDLAGTIARHPMRQLGGFFTKPRPFLPGDFVTTDTGTGLVHMAPDHGEDDFDLCKANGIDPVFAVEGDGKFREDWAWLGGQGSVINNKFNAPDGPICSDLREAGALLAASEFKHSYPHSWRSKAKVIYRCTPQWFIAMDRPLPAEHCETFAEKRWDNEGGALGHGPTLRQLATRAIADTRWVPEKGRNRISSMVEGRPDWVISRQRAWGVPIALFVERQSGQPLVDVDVNHRIVEAIRRDGVDAWSDDNAAHFLGPNRDPEDFERVGDILDVWFDSGCTHVFTLESGRWPDLRWPADLYLEGSDQHRGWFQSSLLESCGTRGRAPYGTVLTHGFTMDSKGMKMSKSLGNTISPLDLIRDSGADILRLWALSVDFTEDHRIGKEILAGVADQYRKLRNTFRYLLGALEGFSDEERLDDAAKWPELERYMLDKLFRLDVTLHTAIKDYDFNEYVRSLTDFCSEDLSAFYFDIRKDSLYCDASSSWKRRAYRTMLDIFFERLIRYAAPVLVFTAEEVWKTRFPEADSVHLLELDEAPNTWMDPELATRIDLLRLLRADVTEAIEPFRRDKVVGSSLEAEVTVPSAEDPAFLQELFITSTVHEGEWSVVKTKNHKCGRCWRHLPEVSEDGDLCGRCEEVVNA